MSAQRPTALLACVAIATARHDRREPGRRPADARRQELRFHAVRANRYGGLFTLHKRPGHRVVGRSLGGSRISVRVNHRTRHATGVLVRPDGKRLPIDRRLHRHRSRYLDLRSIRLNDGRGRGNRTADSRIGRRDVIAPICEP